jgi:hypothetical protein
MIDTGRERAKTLEEEFVKLQVHDTLHDDLVYFLLLLQSPLLALIERLQQDRMLYHHVMMALRDVQRSAQGPLTDCLAAIIRV